MSVIKSVLGTITGDLGEVTFRKWKDKNVLARKPASYSDANTNAQQAQKSAFAQLVQIGRKALTAIRKGFKNYSTSMSEFNYFIKQNVQAFTKSGSTATLNYANLVFSSGAGEGVTLQAIDPAASGGLVDVAFGSDHSDPASSDDDLVHVVLINATTGAVGVALGMSPRSQEDGQVSLATSSGDVIHGYFFTETLSNGALSNTAYATATIS